MDASNSCIVIIEGRLLPGFKCACHARNLFKAKNQKQTMIITVDTDKESPAGLKRAIAVLEDVLADKAPQSQPAFIPRQVPVEPAPAVPTQPKPTAPKKREPEGTSVVQIY